MSDSRSDLERGFSPKGVLNFRGVNKKIAGRVGYEGAASDGITVPFVGKKIGGSDIGHLVSISDSQANNTYIINTGITLSLIAQALKKFVKGDVDKERKF
jgi:hypothetical protein